MADENLGKAVLELEADLGTFDRNMAAADHTAGGMGDTLDRLAAIADFATEALNRIKMTAGQAAESDISASAILDGVKGISDEARDAALGLDRVKLSEGQAAKSVTFADVIIHKLDEIRDHALEARAAANNVSVSTRGGRTGVGVGVFGSGYGRVGLLGTAIGAGVLTGPAAGPAVAGLLAGIPTAGAAAAGVIGTLALAFQGMGNAIGGDLKAYKALEPEQQQFVQTVRSLIPWVDKLKQTAAEGLIPGLTQGLHDALSTGTVGEITQAVTEFATAIGKAGEMWGRYFGSTEFQQIFGPLMAAGAHNFSLLAAAALSLFDALGVLGRAAIPLVGWLTNAAAAGAQLADGWLRAQDASGALAGAMSEAQTSLRLVGGLVVALGRAVGALGIALYPVSKTAVKDLTDGLNALAGIIHNNQDMIRTLVGGALNALVGAVKTAADGIRLLTDGLGHIVGAKASIITAILGIGAAIAIAMGPEAAAIVGAIAAVGLIRQHWTELGTFFRDFGQFMMNVFSAAWEGIKGIFDMGVYGALVEIEGLTRGLEKALGWVPFFKGKIKSALDSVTGFIEGFRTSGTQQFEQAGDDMANAWGDAFQKTAAQKIADIMNNALGQVTDLLAAFGGKVKPKTKAAPKPGTHDWYMQQLGYDPTQGLGGTAPADVFGTPPPFTKNVPTPKAPKPLEIPLNLQALQAEADAAGSKSKEIAAADAIKKWAMSIVASTKRLSQKHIDALDLIAQENSTLKSLKDTSSKQLEVPLSLQLAQAKADASGVESKQKQVAQAINNWAEHMLKTAHLTSEQQIEAYDLISQENSILGQKVTAAARGADEAAFLADYRRIISADAPNATPTDASTAVAKKTNTHLYDMKHELREQTRHLKQVAGRGLFGSF